MPDRKYWRQALSGFIGDDVALGYIDRDGHERRAVGQLLRLGDTGPVLEAYGGEAWRVCDYEYLRSIEDVRF